MPDTIRWGIIGGGDVVVRKSGPAFASTEHSALRAVMRRDRAQAEASARALGAEAWYDCVDDLLADAAVDAVYIATPPALHAEQALACAAAGKPAYVEKPFTVGTAEAVRVVDRFREAGVPLLVAHYRRALPRFRTIKTLLDMGEIGTVQAVRLSLERRYEEDAKHAWLFNPALSGGGKFIDIAPHAIDILVYLLGPFRTIHGLMRNAGSPHGLEDVVAMAFETGTGVLGTAHFDFVSKHKRDSAIILGSEGSIAFEVHGDGPVVVEGRQGRRSLDFPNPEVIEGPMIGEVVRFLTGRDGTPCFGREAIEAVRIIEAASEAFYRSRTASR
jgi:1,5-anhydro-D-fructose reductase (1,5-anhydro-D-mannitol-forming)